MSAFDEVIDRRNTGSLKWDVKENELPMWVADMDFTAAPIIREVIMRRAAHGVFGYSIVPDEWYDAYVSWWKNRHGLNMEKDWLIFTTGIVPAISSIVRKLTTPAENVVVLTPVYNIFYNSILNNGRRVLPCDLIYENGEYSIDFSALEQALKDEQTTLMILCNPHNPIGKIWDRDTLMKIGELCKKYSVTVVSDEIHCDITAPGKMYTPFASVNETCRDISITCLAPTKAFNLAGLQTAAVAVADPVLRHRVWRGLNTDEVAEPNVFAVPAAVAAFTKGEQWLDEFRDYVFENRRIADGFIEKNIPEIFSVKGDATYLMWFDCKKTGLDSDALAESLRKNTGLFVSSGTQYCGNGRNFLRVNIACPRAVLYDGLDRLNRGIKMI
mgnify:FL=1